jgi:hypothetical protein
MLTWKLRYNLTTFGSGYGFKREEEADNKAYIGGSNPQTAASIYATD